MYQSASLAWRGRSLALSNSPNLGFLTVVQENTGYVGGYLVTNSWGRPLEFRLTTMVQPNRVQQILYGNTLKPYIYSDLIGKTLVDRSGVPVHLLITDCQPLLDLRLRMETPVAWLAYSTDPQALQEAGGFACSTTAGPLLPHPRFADDSKAIETVLGQIDSEADFSEPFARIREALSEARKLGATSRGA
jgi:hypothetical protein